MLWNLAVLSNLHLSYVYICIKEGARQERGESHIAGTALLRTRQASESRGQLPEEESEILRRLKKRPKLERVV